MNFRISFFFEKVSTHVLGINQTLSIQILLFILVFHICFSFLGGGGYMKLRVKFHPLSFRTKS